MNYVVVKTDTNEIVSIITEKNIIENKNYMVYLRNENDEFILEIEGDKKMYYLPEKNQNKNIKNG